MAGTTHRIMPMLIAEKDEDVGLFCHAGDLGDAVAPCLAEAIPKRSVFERGGIEADVTVFALERDRYMIVTGSATGVSASRAIVLLLCRVFSSDWVAGAGPGGRRCTSRDYIQPCLADRNRPF